jgi:hypothetical protein
LIGNIGLLEIDKKGKSTAILAIEKESFNLTLSPLA